MSQPLLVVSKVSHNVLKEVDLQAGPASLVTLTGHSGSGKSTLCHLIAGLERPEKGTVTLAGEPASSVTDWSRIAVVPQRLALLGRLTARENLTLPALAAGHETDLRAADDLLRTLGVGQLADRLAEDGSIGEQQRIAVARALLPGAGLIVLDEPTAHQDDENAQRVIAAIRQAVKAGALAVISTHDPRLLERADATLALGSG
jgi:ABC-type lipoprotein export system ATPase subunit